MKKRTILILFLFILALSVFFRFYKLAEIPPGLYPDVAINGINALDAIRTGDFKVFYPDNNGREGLFMNLIALSFILFGPSVWAMKLVAAIFGVLTVVGTFFITKQLFAHKTDVTPETQFTNAGEFINRNLSRPEPGPDQTKTLDNFDGDTIALLSTFFLTISFWHINFSRIGFRAIMVPFFLVWSLYFLFKAVLLSNAVQPNYPNKKSRLAMVYWALAGVFFGLGFHTYIAFRVAPLILVPVFVIQLIKNWPRHKLGPWIIFVIFILAAASPLAYYYIKNPSDFMGRAGQVSIFASENPIKILAQSSVKTIGQFLVWGDTNWRHNLSGSPQVFWPLIPFFIIGIAYSIRQIFKKQNYLSPSYSLLTAFYTLPLWWLTMLLPSIMTAEGLPHALRSIGAIPPTYIFIGLGFYWLIAKVKKINQNSNFLIIRLPFYILAVAFCIGLMVTEYYRYFIYWGQNQETKGAFTQRFVDEADYLNSLPQGIRSYVLVNEGGVAVPYPDGIPMPAQTIKFITLQNPAITYIKEDQFPRLLNENYTAPTVILPMKYDENLFARLKSRFPGGNIEAKKEFSVFKINF